jgi:lambda family phage tail tape measure protein
MSDVIGRGIIELSADSSKVNAAINDARRSIAGLGEASAKSTQAASNSIDRYVTRLQTQAKTQGLSTRETELYKLALRGANDEQLRAANSALKLTEAHQRGVAIGEKISASFLAIGAAAVAGLGAAYVAFDQLVKKAGNFQDIGEKIGDSAENVASLSVAAATGGFSMESLAAASVKLTKNLTGVDDESKAAGAAIVALGLDLEKFKALAPADQMETLGKALNSFADGPQKTAVAVALLSKSGAEALPFLKELGAEGGRQVILTQAQITLADEYSDRQAKMRAQIGLHAQAIAANLLPAMNDLTTTIADLVKDQTVAATATEILKAAFSGAVIVFQTIAVLGSEVGLTFLAVGREIAAIAAQLYALSRLDFQGFTAISDAVKEDGERARKEVDKFQARILAIGTPTLPGAAGPAAAPKVADTRPKLSFDGANKAGAGQGQEAKARLAADLDQIKKGSEALLGAYANADKIMQARRAADLIDEQDYYAAKKGFLLLNSAEQERALQAEITRLQAEKLVGKDKIDNARKIADAQAQLAKVRADTVASAEVLAIQEEAANRKIAQSYTEATIAAQAYLDTIAHQNARAVAGQGQGAKAREEQAGRNQIEDKFTGQRQGLERDLRRGQITKEEFDVYLSIAKETYAKEVELFNQRTADIIASQGDWKVGMSEAMANYRDELADIAKRTETSMTGAFKSIEGAMSDFFFNPFDKGIKGMIASFATAIQRMVADAISADLMRHLVGSGSGSGASKGLLGSLIGAFSGGGYGDLAGVAAGVPQFASGTPYVARTGLAMIHQGERIIPAEQNRGGGQTIIVNVGGGAAPDVRRAAGQGAREALAAFTMAQRYS